MLGRKYAQMFAEMNLNVTKAIVYFDSGNLEVSASENYKGEDTQQKVFRRDLIATFTADDAHKNLQGIEFFDADNNLVWREAIYQGDLEGEYRIRIEILFPYEESTTGGEGG